MFAIGLPFVKVLCHLRKYIFIFIIFLDKLWIIISAPDKKKY